MVALRAADMVLVVEGGGELIRSVGSAMRVCAYDGARTRVVKAVCCLDWLTKHLECWEDGCSIKGSDWRTTNVAIAERK